MSSVFIYHFREKHGYGMSIPNQSFSDRAADQERKQIHISSCLNFDQPDVLILTIAQ